MHPGKTPLFSVEEKTALMDYDAAVRSSWIADELKVVQNAEPAVAKFGGDIGTVLAGSLARQPVHREVELLVPMPLHTEEPEGIKPTAVPM